MNKVKFKKAILTHSSGPQGNLKQLFFVLTQSQKSLLAKTVHVYASKDKMVRIWPTLKKINFLFQPSSHLPIETLCHKNH
jgi:hypothetical protein